MSPRISSTGSTAALCCCCPPRSRPGLPAHAARSRAYSRAYSRACSRAYSRAYSSARRRNVAICARVTFASGQYSFFAASHPDVTPAAAIALIASS